MLRGGANLKQIADLLGHQSINTTTIYAKVDMNTLSQVALPWPGTKEAQP
jgi:site-specific recombinase XerD